MGVLSHSLAIRLISYSRFVITIFYHQIAHFYSIHFASVCFPVDRNMCKH